MYVVLTAIQGKASGKSKANAVATIYRQYDTGNIFCRVTG